MAVLKESTASASRYFCAALTAALLLPACRAEAADLSWRVTANGIEERGLHSLSGADGVTAMVTREGVRCLTPAGAAGAHYLYFQTSRSPGAGPLYLRAEYLDDRPGSGLRVEYDSDTGDSLSSRYRPAEASAGDFSYGTGRWKTALYQLKQPAFQHRQNVGADFRFGGGRPVLRAVSLTKTRPADWDRIARVTPADVRPLVKIGVGGQLIVGGFDPARPEDAAPQARALEAAVPLLKMMGVTSHEGYVRWNLCEPREGVYDWSVYDRFAEVYRRHHLKWVPFLIIGSAYSLPDWYYKKPGSQGYVCLEHGLESDVQSLWNPVLRKHVARFIHAFCAHYGRTGVIESILLGITGNYGEAIYPASGNDWTADTHGNYHTHAGYWAGDPYAVQSFRSWLQKRYGDPGKLNAAWYGSGSQQRSGSALPGVRSFDEVRPFLRKDAPSDRAWLDFTEWYIGSMTDWAGFWLSETRRSFAGDIYLCTGGHAPPEHGSDFGEQCKVAARYHAGVRITNEGSDYRANFSLTRWVASASRQYGAYFSFEPAGGVDPRGVVGRIYNATTSGARGLHYYYGNLFDSDEARENFIRWGHQFQQRNPEVEIAVYYPETHIRLHGNDFLRLVQPLRDRFDFDYMSDGQIRDGGLARMRALIVLETEMDDPSTWSRITDWVNRGGLLIAPSGMEPLLAGRRLLNHSGPGRVMVAGAAGDSKEYRDFVCQALRTAAELSRDTRAMVAADGKEDNHYVSVADRGRLLWLDYGIPPTIREQPVR